MQEKKASFHAYVASLPIDVENAEDKICKINACLGIVDSDVSGFSVIGSVKTWKADDLGMTCPLHWSFAANSFWSGDAQLHELNRFVVNVSLD